jgi:Mrp family chromosome partitioning ATPase/capsular polysaccharide biosynthesis protein
LSRIKASLANDGKLGSSSLVPALFFQAQVFADASHCRREPRASEEDPMEQTSQNEPIELRDMLRPIRARLWLIVLCVSLATALAYYHYSSQPKQYRAMTALYIGSTDPTTLTNANASDRATTDLATLIESAPVARIAAKTLGYKGNPNDLIGTVSAAPATGSDFVDLTAVSGSPQEAAALVNAFADAFVTERTMQMRSEAAQAIAQAQRELNVLPRILANQTQIGQLSETIQQMQGIEALPTAGIQHIDPASPPGAPFAPNPKKDAIFAFVITLMLSIGGAYGLERLDRRIRKLAQVEPVYGYPVLTAVLRSSKPTANADGAAVLPDDLREAFRKLRMNLQLATIEQPPKTMVVTSAVPREGKSTITRNLALAYREAGLNVCVIDADLRRPGLAELLNGPMVPGLTDVVVGDATLADVLNRTEGDPRGLRTLTRLAARPHAARPTSDKMSDVSSFEWPPPPAEADDQPPVGRSALDPGSPLRPARTGARSTSLDALTESDPASESGVGSLVVLPSGPEPANPPVVLGSDQMRSILATLAEHFDIILIDTSPVLAVSDAVPLLSIADGVIVVSRLGMTTTDAAEHLVAQIRRIPGANLLGVVANDVHGRDPGAKTSRYGYIQSRTEA